MKDVIQKKKEKKKRIFVGKDFLILISVNIRSSNVEFI